MKHMLLSKKRAYWSVVSRVGLERASNVDGIDFAKMTFALDLRLTPQERETFRPIQRKMTALLDPIIIDQSDYITHEPANADPAPRSGSRRPPRPPRLRTTFPSELEVPIDPLKGTRPCI
jgi:hypothetical protein